ncbi:response regulator [Geothrix sp. 21YS21S-4]|uniref:response regulator n=1 Tax=Geothrix sp. 21YS21S-4 TaxID=3068889 RepID=UPI0027B88432|nr:response regulator [Geothrix sp. 21YS21S-4]
MKKIPVRTKNVLIVEDEPEHLGWVYEFLESKDLIVTTVKTLPESISILGEKKFDLVIIDMNIPPLDAVTPKMIDRTPLIERFPGIAAAQYCRDHGYPGSAVMAYTVHDDEGAGRELEKMNCKYVLKGRPSDFKNEINKLL